MISFYFRSKTSNYHSIEKVFNNLIIKISGSKKVVLPYESNNLFSIIKNIKYALKNQSNINHVTGDIHYLIPFFSKQNENILTIHDTILLYRERGFKKIIFKIFWFHLPIKYANKIITVSPKTKNELVSLFPKYKNKIEVIPNFYLSTIKQNQSIFKQKYLNILFVGSGKHKNLTNVIEALNNLEVILTIVGYITESDLGKLKNNKIIYKNYFNISQEQLEQIYLCNDVLLYPSLYEGFGLPILEAQGYGLLVITSNIEPMNWVANSNSAILVNPNDHVEINKVIKDILEKKIDPFYYINNGYENLKRFDFDLILKQYFKIYSKY
jgi:glycosyltransferase involved in cell wall biosynthesis